MFQKLQRSMLFPREYAVPDPKPGAGVPGLQRIWLDTDQGQVENWFLPGAGRTEQSPGAAVMFAHGNAELIDHWPEAMRPYRDMGVSVWLGEYRGYGRSAGEPTQTRITEDFVQMYDRLVSSDLVDDDQIVFHGRSLGGAVVSQLAAVREPAAMILESTFTSVADFAKRFMVPRALVADPFDTESVLRTLDVPLLLMHGTRDSIVPFQHAEKLREAARQVTFASWDADHNDFPPDREAYWAEIREFLRTHLGDVSGPSSTQNAE